MGGSLTPTPPHPTHPEAYAPAHGITHSAQKRWLLSWPGLRGHQTELRRSLPVPFLGAWAWHLQPPLPASSRCPGTACQENNLTKCLLTCPSLQHHGWPSSCINLMGKVDGGPAEREGDPCARCSSFLRGEWGLALPASFLWKKNKAQGGKDTVYSDPASISLPSPFLSSVITSSGTQGPPDPRAPNSPVHILMPHSLYTTFGTSRAWPLSLPLFI